MGLLGPLFLLVMEAGVDGLSGSSLSLFNLLCLLSAHL